MVATRRGANKPAEAAPAPSNTLSAPPKRGASSRKKAVAEEVTAPTPEVAKTTRATASKRKAKEEPEASEPPLAKKTTTTRASRTARAEPKAEPAPVAPKRATRGRKAEDTLPTQEPEPVQDAPKPAATRARKGPAKKSAVPEADVPVNVEENAAVEETPKAAPKARKAPVKKALVAKKPQPPVVEGPAAIEPEKPASRARKAAAPKAAPAPIIATRPTRGRNAAPAPQESPLKAPARKPARSTKQSATAAIEAPVHSAASDAPAVVLTEEPFTEFPGYPNTPAHITAPLTSRKALAELPDYPNTPVHIHAPISSKDALAALPDYPKTPAHIKAPINTSAALLELPGYPKTPAHIRAPITTLEAMAEMPGYPKTPAHIQAPTNVSEPIVESSEVAELELSTPEPMEVNGPSFDAVTLQEPELLEVEATTPARPVASATDDTSLQVTPVNAVRVAQTTPKVVCTPNDSVLPSTATPADLTTPNMEADFNISTNALIPSDIVWGITDQEAFQELPTSYPVTPAHITAPLTVKDALAELPGYPKTPAHITAPLTPRRALAELPSYPTTPAHDLEIAIQEEIIASVKKQTPSPLKISGLEDVSFQFAENSEITDFDETELGSEEPQHECQPKLGAAPLATLQFIATLPAPEPASPKKSALRSPQKTDAKTPKKAVTWDDPEESELCLNDGPLQGMAFFVDITRNGMDQNHLFSGLLEDLGARVIKDWNSVNVSHVLFKDGSMATLEKVIASKGAIKCVNVGWILDSEKNNARMDENQYLVDLSVAMPTSPAPAPTMRPFTPAQTPSKYALPPSSECRSVPTTPTSSEFDRSINFDEKENQEHGVFFDGLDKMEVRTVPQKKSSFLFSRSPIRTPSKPSFLLNTPLKAQSAMKPFSTTKKRSLAESTFGGLSVGPPKKLRLF
ncbi:hypothetical protein ACN47E_000455 [Coniothyrium glycines]